MIVGNGALHPSWQHLVDSAAGAINCETPDQRGIVDVVRVELEFCLGNSAHSIPSCKNLCTPVMGEGGERI